MEYVLMTVAEGGFELATLLEGGTSVITWLITAMGSFLTFITGNTALLVWFFVSLAALGLKFIRAFF